MSASASGETPGSYAAPQTAAHLQEACSSVERMMQRAGNEDDLDRSIACIAYLTGIIQAYDLTPYGQPCTVFQLPPGVTNWQLAAVVTAYLRDHPQLLHQQPVFLVTRAFSEAFPCPPKK